MAKETSFADIVVHPIRMRILQHIAGREVTTNELLAELSDVKQATLYRHVSTLIDAGILRVVSSKKVRGATERTLALGEKTPRVDLEEIQAMTTEQLRTSFIRFISHTASNFDRFAASAPNEQRSFLGYTEAPLYLSHSDLERLQNELTEVVTRYVTKPAEKEKQRVFLSTILIPDVSP